MTGENRKERDALHRLADTLVEDILNTPDEDILAEFKRTHGNPAENAEIMRTLFEKTAIAMRKRRLADARAGVAAGCGARGSSPSQIVDIGEARRVLSHVLNSQNPNRSLTLAARKETELSDADVLSMLDNLRELGVVSSDDEKGP